jgi:hypothetical protein
MSFWLDQQLEVWRDALLDGLFAKDPALVRANGQPKVLSAGQVWHYLDHTGLVDIREADAYVGSRLAQSEIKALWDEVRGNFAEYKEGCPLEIPLSDGLLIIYDFVPGADALDYYVAGREPGGVVAELKNGSSSLVLEATGELRVTYNDRVYTESLPPRLVRLLKAGEVEASLSPWFAVRQVENGMAIDDVWTDGELPGSYSELKQLLIELKSQVQPIFAASGH